MFPSKLIGERFFKQGVSLKKRELPLATSGLPLPARTKKLLVFLLAT